MANSNDKSLKNVLQALDEAIGFKGRTGLVPFEFEDFVRITVRDAGIYGLGTAEPEKGWQELQQFGFVKDEGHSGSFLDMMEIRRYYDKINSGFCEAPEEKARQKKVQHELWMKIMDLIDKSGKDGLDEVQIISGTVGEGSPDEVRTIIKDLKDRELVYCTSAGKYHFI